MPIGHHVLTILLLISSPLAAEDWPQFRGPAANGISSATEAPLHWSTTENVKWKTPIPGSGWSSPIVSHGRVYLTTAVNDKSTDSVSLRALALDALTGHIQWNVEVFQPDPATAKQVHTKNSLASSTPIVDGTRLFVHFGHMGTAALDLDGNIEWRQEGITYKPMHGNGSSPILVDDLLVFNCDAASDPFLVALDRLSGEVRWRTPRNTAARQKFSFSTPIVIQVDGRTKIISPGSGFVGAYDPQDGEENWRVRYGDGYSVVPRPVFAHDLVFVSSGYNTPRLLAIDPRGAAGDATDDHIVWSHERGAPLTPSPLVVGDELFLVSDNGIASCLDARSHKVHWTKRLDGAFSASPIYAAGHIYFVNEEGVVYVVRAATDYELVATNDLAERSLASPAVADNALIFRTKSHLWCIED